MGWALVGVQQGALSRSKYETCGGEGLFHYIPPLRQVEYTPQKKLHILDRLAWSEMFESFLANKYTAAKRCVRGLVARLLCQCKEVD